MWCYIIYNINFLRDISSKYFILRDLADKDVYEQTLINMKITMTSLTKNMFIQVCY